MSNVAKRDLSGPPDGLSVGGERGRQEFFSRNKISVPIFATFWPLGPSYLLDWENGDGTATKLDETR